MNGLLLRFDRQSIDASPYWSVGSPMSVSCENLEQFQTYSSENDNISGVQIILVEAEHLDSSNIERMPPRVIEDHPTYLGPGSGSHSGKNHTSHIKLA
jgi:hypothetical protein